MPKVLDMQELVAFIREMPKGIDRAATLAQLAVIQDAELRAKKNAQANFIGRNGRRLSGALMNSIYSGFEKSSNSRYPVAFIGVRNIPYGAIHEFGGTITPKKAKNLWIPKQPNAGRMTPREFMNLRRANPSQYFLNDKVAGRWIGAQARSRQLIPLFFLTKKSVIPERPYLRPAMEVAVEAFDGRFEHFLKAELDG
jgi:phage gpG-like protein